MYSVIIWISYIAYAVIESTLDAWKSKRGGVIDHGTINWSVIFRISSAIGASFILVFDGGAVFHVAYVMMLLLSFWIVFDINFNFVKGSDTGYVGTTAITDKIIRWLGIVDGILYAMIKIMILSIIFIAYSIATTPLGLSITLSVIGFSLLAIYVTYLIKTGNGNKSKSKI